MADITNISDSSFAVKPSGISGQMLEIKTLKAEPAVMRSKADEIQNRLSALKQQFDDIGRAVKGTSTYWNGEAAELHRKNYRDMEPLTDEMFARILDHATDLRQIADIYSQTQSEVTKKAMALPKDAIL